MRQGAAKGLVGFLMIVAAGHAVEVDGLSTKTAEVDGDKDGRADARTEIVSRDGRKQMMVISRMDKSGDWKVTARSFYVGPHMAVTEADEDGDGFFEMVVVYREDPKDVNVFVRERDGSAGPAEVKVVDAMRKQDAVLSEFWKKTRKDPEKFKDAMMEAWEKMKEIRGSVKP